MARRQKRNRQNGEWPACATSDAVQAKIVNIVKNLKSFKIVKNFSV